MNSFIVNRKVFSESSIVAFLVILIHFFRQSTAVIINGGGYIPPTAFVAGGIPSINFGAATTTGTYVVPAYIYQLQVQLWGAGKSISIYCRKRLRCNIFSNLRWRNRRSSCWCRRIYCLYTCRSNTNHLYNCSGASWLQCFPWMHSCCNNRYVSCYANIAPFLLCFTYVVYLNRWRRNRMF